MAMMSACNVSPKQAAGYYHTEDAMAAPGYWFGQGAETLGLRSQVELTPFREVLYGNSPGKQFRLRQQQRSYDATPTHGRTIRTTERAATDLTFSAPKSVSIVALVNEDQQVLSAHESAVTTILNTIQAQHLRTRIKQNGKSLRIQTDNMVAATFLHRTSRNQDPQLHTHCLVMNTTQANDGKWRSMENSMFFDHHRGALSHQYRQELANNLSDLGYRVVWDSSRFFFELGSVHPALITAFSSRRQDVMAAATGSSYRARQFAALQTRAAKQPEQLLSHQVAIWRQQADDVLAHVEQPVAQSDYVSSSPSSPVAEVSVEPRRKRTYIPLRKSGARSPFKLRQSPPGKAPFQDENN